MTMGKKALVWLLVLTVIALGLTSWQSDVLPQPEDITQVKLIRTLALDQGEGAALRLTASGALRKEGDGGQAQPPLLLTQEAMTISAGYTGLEQQSDGFVEFGHLSEFLVGEALARKDLLGIVDYVSRDFAMRVESKVFLVAGDTGEAAIKGVSSRNSAITDQLTAISQDRSVGGRQWPYTFRQLISQLEDNGCALLPVLTLTANPDYDAEGEGETPEKQIALTGLAFLRDAKLVDYLTPEESKGAAIVNNLDQMDTVQVNLSDGSVAAVQLLYAQRHLEARFDGAGQLTGITVHIDTTGELNEIYGAADPNRREVLEQMSEGYREQLRRWVQAVLDRSQGEGTDFLHLRRSLVTAAPLHARAVLDQWEERFPLLDLQVEIHGTVERSYDIDRPLQPGS